MFANLTAISCFFQTKIGELCPFKDRDTSIQVFVLSNYVQVPIVSGKRETDKILLSRYFEYSFAAQIRMLRVLVFGLPIQSDPKLAANPLSPTVRIVGKSAWAAAHAAAVSIPAVVVPL